MRRKGAGRDHRDVAEGYVSLAPDRDVAPGRLELEEVGRRRRWPPTAVGFVALVILVFGIGIAGRAFEYFSTTFPVAPPSPAAIAWVDQPAAAGGTVATQAPVPYNVVPCFTEGLNATARWVDSDSWPAAVLIFTNKSAAECYLPGAPTVRMSYEDGELHDVALTAGYLSMLQLKPGEKMAMRLGFGDLCSTFAQPDVEVHLTVSLNTATLQIPAPPDYVDRCASYPAGAPGAVSVGPFERWPEPDLPVLPAVRVNAVSLNRYLVPGERTTYLIEITNISGADLPLTDCPTYRQFLVGKAIERPREYLLNCEAIGRSLPPGQTVRLEMAFDVPGATAGGPATLVWEATSGFAGQLRAQTIVTTP